jgi:DNA topoisomerase-1
VIAKDFGAPTSAAPRKYETKAKNAQEAHEAIRPTDLARRPKRNQKLSRAGPGQALRADLELRTIACQMEAPSSSAPPSTFSPRSGRLETRFPRHRPGHPLRRLPRALPGGRDDEEDEEARRLPPMSAGERSPRSASPRASISPSRRRATPKPRWSSAWKSSASAGPRPMPRPAGAAGPRICAAREEAALSGGPRPLVSPSSNRFFAKYVEYDFTAGLEEQLDLISNSEIDWRDVLRDFWRDFIGARSTSIKDLRITAGARQPQRAAWRRISFRRARTAAIPRLCPTCGNGRLSLKLGKFGAFIGCSNYPECRYTRPLSVSGRRLGRDRHQEARRRSQDRPRSDAAQRPLRSLRAARRGGRGRKAETRRSAEGHGARRRRSRSRARAAVAAARSRRHPEDGEPIRAGIGRFGPYVQHGKTYANLESGEEVFSIGLNRAVTLIAEKIAKGPRRRFGADPGRPLGAHPTKGGRSWRRTAATVPMSATTASTRRCRATRRPKRLRSKRPSR